MIPDTSMIARSYQALRTVYAAPTFALGSPLCRNTQHPRTTDEARIVRVWHGARLLHNNSSSLLTQRRATRGRQATAADRQSMVLNMLAVDGRRRLPPSRLDNFMHYRTMKMQTVHEDIAYHTVDTGTVP